MTEMLFRFYLALYTICIGLTAFGGLHAAFVANEYWRMKKAGGTWPFSSFKNHAHRLNFAGVVAGKASSLGVVAGIIGFIVFPPTLILEISPYVQTVWVGQVICCAIILAALQAKNSQTDGPHKNSTSTLLFYVFVENNVRHVFSVGWITALCMMLSIVWQMK